MLFGQRRSLQRRRIAAATSVISIIVALVRALS
jgi:hypothetical protein